jgi:TPR repeat protein
VEERILRDDEKYCLEADCLFYGHGIEPNIEHAIIWYQKSAELGNSKAMLTLGKINDEGNGIPQNRDLAFECYKDAADKNQPFALY